MSNFSWETSHLQHSERDFKPLFKFYLISFSWLDPNSKKSGQKVIMTSPPPPNIRLFPKQPWKTGPLKPVPKLLPLMSFFHAALSFHLFFPLSPDTWYIYIGKASSTQQHLFINRCLRSSVALQNLSMKFPSMPFAWMHLQTFIPIELSQSWACGFWSACRASYTATSKA